MSGVAPDPLDRIADGTSGLLGEFNDKVRDHTAKWHFPRSGVTVFVTHRQAESLSAVPALVEVARAARDAEPILDELIGWINTDLTGCLEVEKRGEDARLALRRSLEKLP